MAKWIVQFGHMQLYQIPVEADTSDEAYDTAITLFEQRLVEPVYDEFVDGDVSPA